MGGAAITIGTGQGLFAPVSIAGAILWGVLRPLRPHSPVKRFGFNRRGDSLGGAAVNFTGFCFAYPLFQSQGRFFGGCCVIENSRHIWLILFQSQGRFFGGCCEGDRYLCCFVVGFNRRGDSLGGAALPISISLHEIIPRFNRRGDSLGGAARFAGHVDSHPAVVSIAGAILWGVLHYRCTL